MKRNLEKKLREETDFWDPKKEEYIPRSKEWTQMAKECYG
jgi:hypothetical protein